MKNIKLFESMIFLVRGQYIMLDSDLAHLYGVTTKALIQQVKRNLNRFPEEFMFLPDSSELANLRSQYVTANRVSAWNHMRRNPPYLFTEYGIAMLSSVLESERAISINIAIIRAFIEARKQLKQNHSFQEKIEDIERTTGKLFKVVFERLDNLEQQITPKLDENRKKIGLKD